METIVKIVYLDGPIATGFIHIDENHEITMFTDENGNELTTHSSWYIPEEV
jgi:hypothetical protein